MRRALPFLILVAIACGDDETSGASPSSSSSSSSGGTSTPLPGAGAGRGFPESGPWVSFYGTARKMGDLQKVADTFRIINIDADPGLRNFSPDEIATLKAGGRNRVISYLNLGACEDFRSYWSKAPDGIVPCDANDAAKLGDYHGFPSEQWMDPSNADYQRLILDHVAPRLAETGVDGFFFDNLELLEHRANSDNGPCNDACRQGGFDLVKKLRDKFPNLLFVMQNATGDVVRNGVSEGVPFPTLLDGVSHEDIYEPSFQPAVEKELAGWGKLGHMPGGRPFWLATEDYVGDCENEAAARSVYERSRAAGFSPYVSDESGGQQVVCFWPF